MLSSRRAADLLAMVLVAVPLFGCGDAVTGDARDSRQLRTASGALPHTSADVGEAQDFTPEDAAMMNRISRIEGRHFDLYRHYRGIAARQMHVAAADDDDVDDDNADGALRQAVISFSASSLSQALNGCSMRALLMLD
jgi:hypothetical protein